MLSKVVEWTVTAVYVDRQNVGYKSGFAMTPMAEFADRKDAVACARTFLAAADVTGVRLVEEKRGRIEWLAEEETADGD